MAKGCTAQAEGHITIVVDRATRTLLGAFIGGPGASELSHEAVLAVKLRVTLAQLADTIHATCHRGTSDGQPLRAGAPRARGLQPARPDEALIRAALMPVRAARSR